MSRRTTNADPPADLAGLAVPLRIVVACTTSMAWMVRQGLVLPLSLSALRNWESPMVLVSRSEGESEGVCRRTPSCLTLEDSKIMISESVVLAERQRGRWPHWHEALPMFPANWPS